MNKTQSIMSRELRSLLSRLLSFDTTSRESNLEMIYFIQDYLRQFAIDSTLIFNNDQSKANLYARLGPTGPGGIMLSGHTDVVPTDGQNWSVPPFALTEQDAKCFGRGSTDMKGFIACVLEAIPLFLEKDLRMPLYLSFSYDEEVGCLGVRSLIDHLKNAPEKPSLCIIGEPTNMQPIYGHKGKVAMRCKVHGHACHSAYAPEGVNAIEYAAKLINKINELAKPLKQEQDERFDPPYSTLQTGVIRGGTAINIVPDFCYFDMEMRYLPQTKAIDTIQSLQDYAHQELQPEMQQVRPATSIQFESLSDYPPLLTDPKSEYAQLLTQWCNHSEFGTVAFGTEGGLFDEAGITTFVCGPGSIEQAHKPDEFVTIEQLKQCQTMLMNLQKWMCR